MATLVKIETIGSDFESLSDPRHHHNRKHRLVDVIVIAAATILSGSDGPTAIHRWATLRETWLRQYRILTNGLPSRDCIRRVLMALKLETVQKCFQEWIAAAVQVVGTKTRRLVAMDGKTCRGSHDKGQNLGPLHMVSARAARKGLPGVR